MFKQGTSSHACPDITANSNLLQDVFKQGTSSRACPDITANSNLLQDVFKQGTSSRACPDITANSNLLQDVFKQGTSSRACPSPETCTASVVWCGGIGHQELMGKSTTKSLVQKRETKNKIPCSEIRKRTKIIDIIEYTLKQKWKWAGHIARFKDHRWTKRCTEWQPRRGKRSRGRPSRRWQDDITEKEGTTWIRKATDRQQWKTLMEGYILQWMNKA